MARCDYLEDWVDFKQFENNEIIYKVKCHLESC